MAEKKADKRQTPRKSLVLEVEYESPLALTKDYLTDLGGGGLFIATTASFQVGQTIAFSLVVPGLPNPMHLRGIVRWRRDADFEQSAGVGVELVYPDEETEWQIARILTRVRDRLGV